MRIRFVVDEFVRWENRVPSGFRTVVRVFDDDLCLWLVDTCAGGTWSTDRELAVEYTSEDEARAAVKAGDVA